jgi:dTDP-4-amino-4,6-dideoxygalactose transaminase
MARCWWRHFAREVWSLIPLLDLKAQYRSVQAEVREAIDRVLESSQFVLGSEVAAFEEEFAAYCGAKHGIAMNSGTSALHLAMLAAGIGPGDEVITVPFTFVASVAAITYTGARPVFVDIDAKSYTMDAGQIERAITKNTKAILPVHLYGQAADMDPILEIAKRHRIAVIEDAAQAHGAKYKGRRVGAIGELGCFSFYPSKNLGAYGEGGMVVTNNSESARHLRMLRSWGEERRYYHEIRGFNARMEGFQGAILRVKLRHLEKWNVARHAHAARYNELLRGCAVQTPAEMKYAEHVYHVYAIRTQRREALQKALADAEIQSATHYPEPVHLMKPYADLGYRAGAFPESERMAKEELSIPMYPELREEDMARISAVIASCN